MEISSVKQAKSFTRQRNLKRETESFLIAAQKKKAIKTNFIKAKI